MVFADAGKEAGTKAVEEAIPGAKDVIDHAAQVLRSLFASAGALLEGKRITVTTVIQISDKPKVGS